MTEKDKYLKKILSIYDTVGEKEAESYLNDISKTEIKTRYEGTEAGAVYQRPKNQPRKIVANRSQTIFSASVEPPPEPVPWTPEFIETWAWLKASDAVNLNSTNYVTSIDDSSGYGRNFVVPGTVAGHTLSTTPNGEDTIVQSGASSGRLYHGVGPMNNYYDVFYVMKTSDTQFVLLGSTNNAYYKGVATTDPTLQGIVADANTTNFAARVDGVEVDLSTLPRTALWNAIADDTYKIVNFNWDRYQVSNDTGTSVLYYPASSAWYCTCEFAEVIFLPKKASTSERQYIEGYLAHKYALTANLPSDHPYKTDAPTITVETPTIPTWVDDYWLGTSLTEADGDPVASFTTNAGVIVSQATVSKRGICSTVNGMKGIYFDGVDDSYFSESTPTWGTSYTVVAVFYGTVDGGTYQSIIDRDDVSSNRMFQLRKGPNQIWAGVASNSLEGLAFNTGGGAYTGSKQYTHDRASIMTLTVEPNSLVDVYEKSTLGYSIQTIDTPKSGNYDYAVGARYTDNTQWAKGTLLGYFIAYDYKATADDLAELTKYIEANIFPTITTLPDWVGNYWDYEDLSLGDVGTWADSVGGLNFVQATAGNRPERVSDGVYFDGTNEFMELTTTFTQPDTIIFCVEFQDSSGWPSGVTYICDGDTVDTRHAIYVQNEIVGFSAGTAQTQAYIGQAPQMIGAIYNSTTSRYIVNDRVSLNNIDMGTQVPNTLYIGKAYAGSGYKLKIKAIAMLRGDQPDAEQIRQLYQYWQYKGYIK